MSKQRASRWIDRLLRASPFSLWVISATAILVIGWADWYLGSAVTLGALYILPVVLLSVVLSRSQIIAVAVACAILRLLFTPPATTIETVMVGGFALLSYGLLGLTFCELLSNRREIIEHLSEIQHQQALRQDAEEQLRLLAESSPAAIFTLDQEARILSANRATREMLGSEEDYPLNGRSIEESLPVLAQALKIDPGGEDFRTAAQINGKRYDGTPFLANAWFSTYQTDDGSTRLAAIVVDSTEETREREAQSQEEMLDSNRIIAGAIAHEVRNISGAMSMVYSNLESASGLQDNPDYRALGYLITGLGGLARLELNSQEEARSRRADLRDVLNQLRILIGPAWTEEQASIQWPELTQPLLVSGDGFSLLQACLNIANNSLSAVSNLTDKWLLVEVDTNGEMARVSFVDSAAGVAEADNLFLPFRSGSGRVGLGLYISRALLRRNGGDVRYRSGPEGGRFVVEMPLHGVKSNVTVNAGRDSALAG